MAEYTIVLPVRHYARFKQAVAAAESRFLHSADLSHNEAQRAARAVRIAFNEYEDELKSIAIRVAGLAQNAIKREEKRTRVRPDTRGGGGPRLNQGIGKSRAINVVPGSVGINDHEYAVEHGVDWWWTNEFGYSGHVGRVVHGFFYDAGFTGRSRPDASRMQEHALFRPEGAQRASGYTQLNAAGQAFKKRPRKQVKGKRPGMLIQNPILARNFVRRGGRTAELEWHRAVERARQRFLRKLAAI